MTGVNGHSKWLTTQELADEFGISVATVYAWRRDDRGPRGIRIGKYIKYRRTDVDAWRRRQDELTGRGDKVR